MRQTINGADLRRMIISAAASIEIHKQKLNDLNVFPVPDGDTGTNMAKFLNISQNEKNRMYDCAVCSGGATGGCAKFE